jgi:hypothetical protein
MLKKTFAVVRLCALSASALLLTTTQPAPAQAFQCGFCGVGGQLYLCCQGSGGTYCEVSWDGHLCTDEV